MASLERAVTPKCQPSTALVVLTKPYDDSRFLFQISTENVGVFSVRPNFSHSMYVLWKYLATSSVCSATVSSKFSWSYDLPSFSVTKLKQGSTRSGWQRLTQESFLGSKWNLDSNCTLFWVPAQNFSDEFWTEMENASTCFWGKIHFGETVQNSFPRVDQDTWGITVTRQHFECCDEPLVSRFPFNAEQCVSTRWIKSAHLNMHCVKLVVL